jgi:hypothetical protein
MAVPVLSVGDVTVREPVLGDAAAVFTVLLSEASDVPVSVAWATGEGTGAHPASGAQIYMVIDGVKQVVASSATRQYLAFVADFIHDRDTLTFAPGETAKTVTIAVRGENVSVDAAEESFVLVLGDAVGATIGRGTAVATIIDSAVPSATVPAIVVAAGSAVEPPAGFGPNLHAVRVALGNAHVAPVSVDYATVDGTAVAGADYGAVAGTLTFLPGETVKFVDVPILGDAAVEPAEGFGFVLSNAVNGDIAAAGGMVEILDTQPPVPLPEHYFGVTTDGVPGNFDATPYAGPVAGLSFTFIGGAGGEVVAGTGLGDFINSKGGTDAIAGLGGDDVLDGGLGSNFLSGGEGRDTFFLDARELSEAVWSTVTDLAPGEGVTLWGLTEADFAREWTDGLGAEGFTGLTLVARQAGLPEVALTLSGYTRADLDAGRLVQAFGTEPVSGSSYMYLHAVA